MTQLQVGFLTIRRAAVPELRLRRPLHWHASLSYRRAARRHVEPNPELIAVVPLLCRSRARAEPDPSILGHAMIIEQSSNPNFDTVLTVRTELA